MNDLEKIEQQECHRKKQERTLESAVDYFLNDEGTSRKHAPESVWANIFWFGWTLARYWETLKAPFQLFYNGWFQYRQEWSTRTPRKTFKKYGDQYE